MGWTDKLANINVKAPFQTLLIDFQQLHGEFCKDKNLSNFSTVAYMLNQILELIEDDAAPIDATYANLSSILQVQLGEIIRKKSGNEGSTRFTELTTTIGKHAAELKSAMEKAMLTAKQSADAKVDVVVIDSKAPQKAIVQPLPVETLRSMIDELRYVPMHEQTCNTRVKRAAARQPVASGLSAFSFSAAVGAAIQAAVTPSDEPISPLDIRIVVPTGLALVSFASASFAFFKSKPPASKVPDAKYTAAEEERGIAPLLINQH